MKTLGNDVSKRLSFAYEALLRSTLSDLRSSNDAHFNTRLFCPDKGWELDKAVEQYLRDKIAV